MFYYLDGTVAYLGPNLAVIDCGGVGYACATTSHTLSRLQLGARTKLFTHLNVKEDGVDLFGFYKQNELSAFRQLIGVSGVGPKAALAILSSSTPDQLALAIVTGDERVLVAAPGIGKKIAQRIILELKDKMSKEDLSGIRMNKGGARSGQKTAEALSALMVLGYSQQEVGAALKGIDVDALPLEEIVRQALKKMVK